MTGRWVLRLAAYAAVFFVATPIVAVIGSSVTATNYVAFPPQGFTLKWYAAAFENHEFHRAVVVSLIVAMATAALSTTLGLSVCFAMERYRFRGRDLINTLLLAPVTVPMIGLGVGMLFFMTAIGLIRTIPGLVLAHSVVSLPYAMRSLSSAIGGIDHDVERSASILGASPLIVLLRVTLPMIMPGLMAAVIFSFVHSFNNVTISLFITGVRNPTLPITLFHLTEKNVSPQLASIASIVLLSVTGMMVFMEMKFKLYSLTERGRTR